jgi:TPR repeat protein
VLARSKAVGGDAEAQFIVGDCYDHGHAVQKDFVETIKWYRKSAAQNYAAAQFNLCLCYVMGRKHRQGRVNGLSMALAGDGSRHKFL